MRELEPLYLLTINDPNEGCVWCKSGGRDGHIFITNSISSARMEVIKRIDDNRPVTIVKLDPLLGSMVEVERHEYAIVRMNHAWSLKGE